MNIKLEQYKIFNEAASCLSFSIAARNLFISQSAISQCIRTLENELEVTLFNRSSKGVTLTKEGEMLYKQINMALSLITDAENQLSQVKDLHTGELTIGAGDTLCEHNLLPYLKKFHELFPHVNIQVINRTSLEIIDLLKSNSIDIGFINLPINDEAIEAINWLEVHDIFVSRENDEHTYSYSEIALKDLILLEKASNSRHYLDKVFSKEGVLLKPTMELGAHKLLLEFASVNLGISCVIKEFSHEFLDSRKLYELKLEKPLEKRYIGYAYLKRKTQSMTALKFIELLNESL